MQSEMTNRMQKMHLGNVGAHFLLAFSLTKPI